MKKLNPLVIAFGLLAAGCAVALLSGCALRQASTSIQFGSVKAVVPKDSKIGWMRYEETGTNRSITLSNCTFTTNPDVLDAATRHDVQVFKAGAEAAGQLMGAGAKAAAGGL